MEIRTRLAFDGDIKCNEDDDNYKTYMAKNMFYFKSLKYNTYGSDLLKNQETVYCIPTGFDVLDREIAYCEYAIKKSPAESVKDWEAALCEYNGRKSCTYISSDLFF